MSTTLDEAPATAASDIEDEAWELAAQQFAPAPPAKWKSPGDLAQELNPRIRQTDALRLLDEHLVWAANTPDARLIISFPPQEGKSQRASRAFPVWLLARNPNLRIVLASYESNVARRMSRQARDDVAANPAALGFRLRKDVASQHEWEIEGREGGFYATGIGAALTSRPADVLIIDDPVKGREQADSLTYRDRAWDWWLETAATRLSPGAPVIVIQTRWHPDDLAGRLLAEDAALPEDEREWRVLNIPAQCDDEATDPLGRKLGEFLDSARNRTVKQWERIKRRSARTWAALYQGHPAPAEGGIFKWEWITPHRVQVAPPLVKTVVAVDPTGGGADAAGVMVMGRGTDRRTYVLADRSGLDTMGGQWRRAWFAVLEFDADQLVYESNLVDPAMRKAIPAAWSRMREQALALRKAGLDGLGLGDITDEQWAAAAAPLGKDDDAASDREPSAVLRRQLREVHPWVQRILAAPEFGPASVHGVRASKGKVTRAEPVAGAYEDSRVSHVGVHAALEGEQVTWQEGQASPNRLDAMVWGWYALNSTLPAQASTPAGSARVPMGPQQTGGRGRRRTGPQRR